MLYEIPELVTRPHPRLENRYAKPGCSFFPPSLSDLPPVVRWTHYGRWDVENLTVTNQHGQVIYPNHPHRLGVLPSHRHSHVGGR